jgi:hypothetical protein
MKTLILLLLLQPGYPIEFNITDSVVSTVNPIADTVSSYPVSWLFPGYISQTDEAVYGEFTVYFWPEGKAMPDWYAYWAIDVRHKIFVDGSLLTDCYDTLGVMTDYPLYAEGRAKAYYFKFTEK